ncbi:mCG21614, isoform CRA_c [Mus musculus]|nr:mCG21614, isoform CRA_c [Mus musculus]
MTVTPWRSALSPLPHLPAGGPTVTEYLPLSVLARVQPEGLKAPRKKTNTTDGSWQGKPDRLFREWCARAFFSLLDQCPVLDPCHLLISISGHLKQPVYRNSESSDSRNNQDTLKDRDGEATYLLCSGYSKNVTIKHM